MRGPMTRLTFAASALVGLAGAGAASAIPVDLRGQAQVNVDFGGALGLAYSPEDVVVDPGTTVVFRGDLDLHLLRPSGPGPIPSAGPLEPPDLGVDDPDLPVTFASAGSYRYICLVHDPTSGMRGVIRVGNAAPSAVARVSTPSPQVGRSVTFTAASSSDPDALPTDALRYAWDLDGNGSFETVTATTPTASRTYASPGPVTVRVQVTDAIGGPTGTATAAVPVTIAAAPADVTPPGAVGLGRLIARTGAVTLRLRLSERATLSGRLERRRPGSRPPRFALLSRLSPRVLARGPARLALGRLAAGRYRVVATLRDPSGNRRVATIGFTV